MKKSTETNEGKLARRSNSRIQKYVLSLLVSYALILFIGIIYAPSRYFAPHAGNYGTFGDFFGGTANIVALLGVIIALILQTRQLKLQGEELELAKDNLLKQGTLLERQTNLMFWELKGKPELKISFGSSRQPDLITLRLWNQSTEIPLTISAMQLYTVKEGIFYHFDALQELLEFLEIRFAFPTYRQISFPFTAQPQNMYNLMGVYSNSPEDRENFRALSEKLANLTLILRCTDAAGGPNEIDHTVPLSMWSQVPELPSLGDFDRPISIGPRIRN